MRLAIDTNTYIEFVRGNDRAVETLRSADEIYISFIALAELRSGFFLGTKGQENEAKLAEFLNSTRVRILLADEQTTHHYARIFAYLRNQGTPIPTNDLWIAALVIQHDLVLYSKDTHFSHVPQIVRVGFS